MMQFISEYGLLILGFAGAVVGFLGMVLKYKAENRKARMVLACAILGFLFLLGQQVVGHILGVQKDMDTKRKEQIKKARQDIMNRNLEVQGVIIKKIEDDVVNTRYTVEKMAKRLERLPLEALGTRLVAMKPGFKDDEFDEIKAFAKGKPEMWKLYADWLDKAGPGASLSLIPGADKNYNPGLVLAYLMTNQETKRDIKTVINNFRSNPDSILNFPDSSLLKKFSDGNGGVKWVVFLKKTNGQLFAYADARSFAKELTIHYRLGDRDGIRKLLNEPNLDLHKNLSEEFASVRLEINKDPSTESVVKSMLAKPAPSIAVVDDSSQYIVSLEQVVQKLSVKN